MMKWSWDYVHQYCFLAVHEQQNFIEWIKNPVNEWTYYGHIWKRVNYHSTSKIIGGVDFLAVHERAFYGPHWTKSLAKGLFHCVHQHLYGIVAEQAFIPRCWTHPNSLADYLVTQPSFLGMCVTLPSFLHYVSHNPVMKLVVMSPLF